MASSYIKGNFVDLFARAVYPAGITIKDGLITHIEKLGEKQEHYILPGFVDAHVHIESSMLVPTEFARIAVTHGTVATVSDPHEIANVCGAQGVQYMIDNAAQTPFKFFFGAPSCVPATSFETAGAVLDAAAVEKLLQKNDIWYLAEMMNYPGVIDDDPEVMAKIRAAKECGKPVDGHAPGVRGSAIEKYAAAGIATDHESFTLDEALEKVGLGIKCLIREGSAARNFEALKEMIRLHPEQVMFCSDDKHPDELMLHHINNHVKRAVAAGYDVFDVLRAASLNPVLHYKLPVGLLRINDPADFIVVSDLESFSVVQTYIDGILVAENGETLLPYLPAAPINNFKALPVSAGQFKIPAAGDKVAIRVIEVLEGQLITHELTEAANVVNGFLEADTKRDLLKMTVINRYVPHVVPSVCFIRNFGLQQGAIASTVAHDCHNIIAVGGDDAAIAKAVNALVDAKGGIAVVDGNGQAHVMPLPVAGLMTDDNGYSVAEQYSLLDKKARELGTRLKAPFMSLSFMALLVIPELKLSDKGLFDGRTFNFTDLQVAG